eukprot:Cvel_31938.t1-p1 / transcript=Cvel_31938.t1 / gene=Cvel_31938 / organism=Chromera_velia_CCMP2878 / gene_product=hypothetical protein / transcript_product=hypothetical protein / location=Cvel_scaffold4856:1-1173(-) / protein_length=309 / sequence_SO=supercontig / SO=protein_coding / is_pseudo=false
MPMGSIARAVSSSLGAVFDDTGFIHQISREMHGIGEFEKLQELVSWAERRRRLSKLMSVVSHGSVTMRGRRSKRHFAAFFAFKTLLPVLSRCALRIRSHDPNCAVAVLVLNLSDLNAPHVVSKVAVHQAAEGSSRDSVIVAFGPRAVVSAGCVDGRVVFADLSGQGRSAVKPETVCTHSGGVKRVVLSPDGRCVVSAGVSDGRVVLSALSGQRESHTLPLGSGRATFLAFSPDSGTLAVLAEWEDQQRVSVYLLPTNRGIVEAIPLFSYKRSLFRDLTQRALGSWAGTQACQTPANGLSFCFGGDYIAT